MNAIIKLLVLFTFVLVPLNTAASRSAYGQIVREGFTSASVNPSFEGGLEGWTRQDLQATVFPKVTAPDSTGFRGTPANNTAVRLTGRGAFGQFREVDPDVEFQLLRAFAWKEATDGGIPGRASIVATYYDTSWNEVAKYEYDIDEQRNNISITFEGSDYTSYGAWLPDNAAFVFLFVWIYDDNTEVAIDDLELLDVNYPTGTNANLLLNTVWSGFFRNPSHPYPTAVSASGREFWRQDIDPNTNHILQGNRGFKLGYSAQAQSIEQRVALEPTTPYQLKFSRYGGSNTPAGSAVGVDLFDENYTFISAHQVQLSSGLTDRITSDFDTPAETSFGVFWVRVPASLDFAVQPYEASIVKK